MSPRSAQRFWGNDLHKKRATPRRRRVATSENAAQTKGNNNDSRCSATSQSGHDRRRLDRRRARILHRHPGGARRRAGLHTGLDRGRRHGRRLAAARRHPSAARPAARPDRRSDRLGRRHRYRQRHRALHQSRTLEPADGRHERLRRRHGHVSGALLLVRAVDHHAGGEPDLPLADAVLRHRLLAVAEQCLHRRRGADPHRHSADPQLGDRPDPQRRRHSLARYRRLFRRVLLRLDGRHPAQLGAVLRHQSVAGRSVAAAGLHHLRGARRVHRRRRAGRLRADGRHRRSPIAKAKMAGY